MENSKAKTVNPELIEAFIKIAPSVTTDILMETALELGCHYATIQRYLWGRVKKEQFGTKLLTLLQRKIALKNGTLNT